MAKSNRVCMVCGKHYFFCPTCNDNALKENWHIVFDSENCKNIFETLCSQTQKIVTTEEAKRKLNTYDLSGLSSFNENIKNHINRILKSDEKEESDNKLNELEKENESKKDVTTVVKPRRRSMKNSECKLEKPKENIL